MVHICPIFQGNHGLDTLGMAVENLAVPAEFIVLAAHVLVLPGVLSDVPEPAARLQPSVKRPVCWD